LIGKVVYQSPQTPMETGNHELRIDTKDFVSGIYFVKLRAGDKTFTKKLSSF
jgi:hypothetical protein